MPCEVTLRSGSFSSIFISLFGGSHTLSQTHIMFCTCAPVYRRRERRDAPQSRMRLPPPPPVPHAQYNNRGDLSKSLILLWHALDGGKSSGHLVGLSAEQMQLVRTGSDPSNQSGQGRGRTHGIALGDSSLLTRV